ncbi:MAG: hypothetical protein ACLT3K_08205 [Bacteroides ovatus]
MKKGRQDRIAETLTGVKDVKKRLFFICSQKTPIKQMITIREGCEGGELNFIGAWVIFGTISSKPHRY